MTWCQARHLKIIEVSPSIGTRGFAKNQKWRRKVNKGTHVANLQCLSSTKHAFSQPSLIYPSHYASFSDVKSSTCFSAEEVR